MNTTNPIIGKIQKLLRTASDAGATPEEAATAMAIAQRLIQTHRITEDAIRAHARGEAQAAGAVRPEDMDTLVLGPRKGRHDGWLAQAVGEVCGVGVYLSTEYFGYRSVKTVTGYGLPADLAVAREIFAWVQAQLIEKRRGYARGIGQRTTSIPVRSYADGFSIALLEKAREDRKLREASKETVEVKSDVGETLALVCVSDATQSMQRALAVKARQLGLGKGRARSVNTDWSARSAGAAAGRAVNLSRQVVR